MSVYELSIFKIFPFCEAEIQELSDIPSQHVRQLSPELIEKMRSECPQDPGPGGEGEEASWSWWQKSVVMDSAQPATYLISHFRDNTLEGTSLFSAAGPLQFKWISKYFKFRIKQWNGTIFTLQ